MVWQHTILHGYLGGDMKLPSFVGMLKSGRSDLSKNAKQIVRGGDMPKFGVPGLNVMVTWVGINEHGNRVTDLHQLEFDSEEKLLEWINSAPVASKPVDPGPDVRIELPMKKF